MVWAVLQFALPALASSADAHLEGEGRAQVAHIESTSSSSCRSVHPAECALCQLLNHHSTPLERSSEPQLSVGHGACVSTEHRTPALASRSYLPHGRAPPHG